MILLFQGRAVIKAILMSHIHNKTDNHGVNKIQVTDKSVPLIHLTCMFLDFRHRQKYNVQTPPSYN